MKVVTLSLAFVAGLGSAILVGLSLNEQGRVVPEAISEGLNLPPEAGPLPGGQESSLAAVERRAPFRIHRPSDSLASDQDIAKIWFQPATSGGPSVAIQYSSGLEVILEIEWVGDSGQGGSPPSDQGGANDPPRDFEDVARRLAEQAAAQRGGEADDYLGEVKGGTAYISPYEQGFNTGAVLFSLGDRVRVAVYGDFDSETLLRVARSLD